MDGDNEELLQYSDDDSLSETEDHCCPVEKPENRFIHPLTFFPHTEIEFAINLTLLILSSVALLIIFPLYINTVNEQGNVFSILVINIPLSITIFALMLIFMRLACNFFIHRKILELPIKFWKHLQLSCLYMSFVYLYLYGSDRNRVVCHLQDPIKGILLVFALLYYFFCCRNLMGLHRIFSTTTVIVGLFIAVDYGLCDEFVCRGYERERVSDDAGLWKWKTHSVWTGLYVLSLLLFAAFYTLLDRYIAPEYITMPQNVLAPSFLNTISRSVTGSSSRRESDIHEHERTIFGQLPVKKSAIHFAMWLHIFLLVVMICTFWIEFIPGVGKGDTVRESINYTINGVLCHFFNHASTNQSKDNCSSVLWLAIGFQLAYVTFVLSSIKFLMLCQSAVFAVAAMSSALPVIGVWWTLFYASPQGQLVWSPKIRGEFVCSIIGLPIVFIGLALLCKAHFQDLRRPRYFNSRGPHP